MSYLGLDMGTSGCKAVIFDNGGAQRASAFREYATIHAQPGWAELDPDEVLSKCLDAIKEVAFIAPDPVLAIGVSSQGEAFALRSVSVSSRHTRTHRSCFGTWRTTRKTWLGSGTS